MRKAFSLVELLVTIAILAIVVVIVLPSLFGGSRVSDLNSTTQQVVASARVAQSQSASQVQGIQWGIHFANATNTAPFYAVFSGSSYSTGTVQGVYRLPADVAFVTSTLATGATEDVLFNTVSGNTSAPATIGLYVVSQPSLSSTITIDSAGSISAVTPTTPSILALAPITFSTSTYATGVGGPDSIAFDSHTNTVWVSDLNDGDIFQFNDMTYATSSFTPGDEIDSSAFDPHTNAIWTASSYSGGVTQVNDMTYVTSTYTDVEQPDGMAFDSHTNTIWLTELEDYTSNLTQVNDMTYATSSYTVDGSNPLYCVAFDSHTNTVWVGGYGSKLIQINDTTYATSTYAASVGDPCSVAFDSHTNTVWVTGLNKVTQINDMTYATSSYTVSGALGVAFDSHTNSVWVGSTSNKVTQINDTTYATSTYAVPFQSRTVAFDSHTNTIWVASYTGDTVTVFTPSR